MTDETLRQQTFNSEIIARFAGLSPSPKEGYEEKEPKCPDCGGEDGLHYCQCNKEISQDCCRNGDGICNECR